MTFTYTDVELADALFSIILGPDWRESEHTDRTAERFVNSLREILEKDDKFHFTTFPNSREKSEMVVVGPVFFHSVCAHHVLPFTGHAWVGYIPNKKIAGLSKLARAVRWMSSGLWTQEDLSYEIATFLEENLEPLGVAVLMKAEHLCMTIRGVQAPGALTTTSEMRGVFLKPPDDMVADPRLEFFGVVNNGR